MAEVLVRIGIAVVALAIAAALTYELVAHDMLANSTELAAQPNPDRFQVALERAGLRTVAKLRPGSQAALAEAALDLRIRDYKTAVAAARRATKREPENFSAWVTLAVALGNAGDKAGRDAAFVRAHELNPLYPIPR